jgi:GNAT superfamily N-acetyltransferase
MRAETLRTEAWDQTHPRWDELCTVVAGEGQTDWMEASASYHHSTHMLVALWADEIAGFLRYVHQPIGPDAGCPAVTVNGEVLIEAKVLAFAVVAPYRRKGIGRALQLEVIRLAKAQGCYQLRSHSGGKHTANQQLKLALGFAVHPIVRGEDRQGVYFLMPLRTDE